MSPSIVLKKTGPELHIPWKTFVKDGRTAKERMAAGEKICAVTFTNQDALTVCCVLNSDGAKENVFFVRGGAEYAHRCRQVTDKIKKSEASGSSGSSAIPNSRYWMKLKNLNDFYSHSISRQVINYTIKQGAKIIVLPEYEKKGQNFVCKNGHQGNYYLNASWNLGLKCIHGFQPKEPRTSD